MLLFTLRMTVSNSNVIVSSVPESVSLLTMSPRFQVAVVALPDSTGAVASPGTVSFVGSLFLAEITRTNAMPGPIESISLAAGVRPCGIVTVTVYVAVSPITACVAVLEAFTIDVVTSLLSTVGCATVTVAELLVL